LYQDRKEIGGAEDNDCHPYQWKIVKPVAHSLSPARIEGAHGRSLVSSIMLDQRENRSEKALLCAWPDLKFFSERVPFRGRETSRHLALRVTSVRCGIWSQSGHSGHHQTAPIKLGL
jgi:hypothetical protein